MRSVVKSALAKLGALLIVGAAGYWLGYSAGGHDVRAQWSSAELDAQRRLAEERAQAARERAQALETVKEELDAHAQRANAAVASAARAGRELDRLRAQLSAVALPAPGAAACAAEEPHGAAALADVLGECASQLQAVAGEADRLAVRLSGLQGYVRAVAGTRGEDGEARR